MTKEKFTPAPWNWRFQPNALGSDTDEIYIEASGREICRIDPDMVEVPLDQCIANANLIAAAPEMYEALKSMLNIFDRGLGERTIGRSICDEAKQVLSKAMGKNE